MKLITTLLFVQVLLLSWLIFNDLTGSNPPVREAQKFEEPFEDEGVTGELMSGTQGQAITLDENAVRQIIRSELAHFADNLTAEDVSDETAEPEIDPVENEYRLQLVREELSFYISRGEISDAEMDRLQAQISQLDPDNRGQMMSRLANAIVTGELRGRF